VNAASKIQYQSIGWWVYNWKSKLINNLDQEINVKINLIKFILSTVP